MAAARSKPPAIGSSRWILDERHQANDLVSQELEDFGFSVRNELEWLNEHMMDIFTYNGQNNLDVYKTPGKLRGKTPRTARKKAPVEARQPLGDLFAANSQHRPSPAQHSLQNNLQKNLTKAKFQIAEDAENVSPARSPVKSSAPRPLFGKPLGKGKENHDSGYHASEDSASERRPVCTAPWSPVQSTQDTVMHTQEDTSIFTQEHNQSTQPTQYTQSFKQSIQQSEEERRDTGESFVSAKEAFGSKTASNENLREHFDGDAMEVNDDKPDTTLSDAQDTVIRHEISSLHENSTVLHHELPMPPQQLPSTHEQHSNSADMQEALDTADFRAHTPEPRSLALPAQRFGLSAETDNALDLAVSQDDTVVHHDVDDQMDIDDVRSPSDGSSPVKPLVRKSSLTFASLPAREPLIAKKSMGTRVSRTSHVDQSKSRNSQLGRFTGGKSLGGSQYAQATDPPQNDAMDLDEDRPELQREESETTKIHNKTSTQRLAERINMLNQKNEVSKGVGQQVVLSQPNQPQSFIASQLMPSQQSQTSQPVYPQLAAQEPETDEDNDDDEDWISPVRTTAAPGPNFPRPILSKSHSADMHPLFSKESLLSKPVSVSNPDLSTVVESTTPAGSPAALRAAREKIIGSSATSAQVKLEALTESQMRPKLDPQSSSEDVFSSPKRNEKAGLFSHLRSPSKESVKTTKSGKIAPMPGSPTKEDGRRTRSSSDRERQKEKEVREKEAKQKQRTEERLEKLREKEQSKAAAHYQKAKAAAKTPVAAPPQPNTRIGLAATAKTPISMSQLSQPRPGTTRMNTAPRQPELDSADEMPLPPPGKSNLPTGAGHKLREPKRLAKAPSKDTLPKAKPQAIKINLNSRFGQAPAPASKNPSSQAPKAAPPAVTKPMPPPPAPKATSVTAKPSSVSRAPPPATKAARVARPQPPKVVEKPKPTPAQPRSDLGAARPVSRMQTVQDANRINVPPMNPAKPPPKRPFQPENDEPLHRPAKRPSQLAKSKPVTPAHAQFAQGKIPFAEPTQPPAIQYPNGEDIKLPDIMTDSEDEDSENEFEAPEWTNTPNLNQVMTQQQLLDPEYIFGPIAPLNMEQMFPNKERHKRFRERTSSAFWTNDQVTEEEKRKEREARERLVKEGAWTYHPSPGPER